MCRRTYNRKMEGNRNKKMGYEIKRNGRYRRLAGNSEQDRNGMSPNSRSNKKVRSLHSPSDMAPFIDEETRCVGGVTHDYSNVHGWN